MHSSELSNNRLRLLPSVIMCLLITLRGNVVEGFRLSVAHHTAVNALSGASLLLGQND